MMNNECDTIIEMLYATVNPDNVDDWVKLKVNTFLQKLSLLGKLVKI